MVKSALQSKRVVLLLSLCSMFLLAVVIRLGFVQLRDGPFLKNLADEEHYRGVPVESKRGNIEDSQGNILAMSASSDTVYAVPAEVRKSGRQEEIAAVLAGILGQDQKSVYQRITKRTSLEYVQKKVTTEIAQKVEAANLPGIGVVEGSQRFYPNGILAAHVLGFTGVDSQGLEGIEASRDEELTGKSGSILTEYGADGIKLPEARHQYVQPQQGNTVRLTIDKNIQAFAERELAKIMSGQGVNMEGRIPKSVTMVAMDPNTGKILAIASAPTFDPNHYQNYPEENRRIIAVQNGYEPGSTFKIVTLAAALEEKVIHPQEGFYDSGAYTIMGRRVRCWKSGGHGSQTMTQVVENSCNPGFIEMGQRLGLDTFYHYLEGFGFGQKTGIEMVGEAKGIVAKKERATLLDLATMSIGQTNNVTAIQLLTAVCAVANGGELLQPQLVQEIRDPSGKILQPFEKKLVHRMISASTAATERAMLESVVTNGSGRRAFLPGYRVAGKTGTAQKVMGGVYLQNEYVASFVCFAPADRPQIAVLTVIDGVPFHGGVVAAPATRAVLEDTFKYLGIKPDLSAPLSPGTPMYGVEYPAVKNPVKVPFVLGKKEAEGRDLLAKAGFQVSVQGSGPLIVDQFPFGEAQIEKGSTVVIYLGTEVGSTTFGQHDDEDPDEAAWAEFAPRIPLVNQEGKWE